MAAPRLLNITSSSLSGRPATFTNWRKLLLLVMLVSLALLLTACSYPGKGDCRGVGNDSDPTSGVTNCVTSRTPTDSFRNEKESGPWYTQWIIDSIRTILISASAAAINISTGIFILIFDRTGSLDFAGCSDAWGSRNPFLNGTITCVAHDVWWTVTGVTATALLPLLVLWKLFSTGLVGAVIEEFRESLWSSVGKLIITGLVLYYLSLLYTSLIGFSELLFNLVLGGDGYQTVMDIGFEIRRTAATLEGVQNLGMLALLVLVSLLAALVFLVLGLAFFARTVLIIVMYVMSGPAVLAATSDEFRGWFLRWWNSVLALVIAPLPVAACLLMVQKASSLVLNASDVDKGPFQAATDPYSFTAYMLYVTCFLVAAAWFLLALTAHSGRVAGGALRSGMRAIGSGVGAIGLGAYAGSRVLRGSGAGSSGGSNTGGGIGGNTGRTSGGFSPDPVIPANYPVAGSGQSFSDLGQSMRGVQLGLQELARTGTTSPQLPPPRPGGDGWGRGDGYSPTGSPSAPGPFTPASPAGTAVQPPVSTPEPGYYRVKVEGQPPAVEYAPPAHPDAEAASYRYVSEEDIKLSAYRPGTIVSYSSENEVPGAEGDIGSPRHRLKPGMNEYQAGEQP